VVAEFGRRKHTSPEQLGTTAEVVAEFGRRKHTSPEQLGTMATAATLRASSPAEWLAELARGSEGWLGC